MIVAPSVPGSEKMGNLHKATVRKKQVSDLAAWPERAADEAQSTFISRLTSESKLCAGLAACH